MGRNEANMPKKTPAPAMKPHTGKVQFIASPKTSTHKTKPQKKAERKLIKKIGGKS
jgi:hypothetical protein